LASGNSAKRKKIDLKGIRFLSGPGTYPAYNASKICEASAKLDPQRRLAPPWPSSLSQWLTWWRNCGNQYGNESSSY